MRQTSNQQAQITLAWTYSPGGGVLIGEKGPVTNLGCGDMYDWSTGLVYKNGNYFDPNLGIWLTFSPLVIWGRWFSRGKRNRRKITGSNRFLLVLSLLLLAATLSGCNQPNPSELPECRTPIPMPSITPAQTPTLPPIGAPYPSVAIRPPLSTPTPQEKFIIDATVIIQYGESTPNGFKGQPSLGTVVDGGGTIITHNHFDPLAEASAKEVLVRKPQHPLWELFPKSVFQSGISLINHQAQQIKLPRTLSGVSSATIGRPQLLKVGSEVNIAYYNENIDFIQVYNTVVKDIALPINPRDPISQSVLSAFVENRGVINMGDSGGGMFFNGKLVGTHWFSSLASNEAVSALLLP